MVELDVDDPVNDGIAEDNIISCIPTFFIYKYMPDKDKNKKVKVVDLKGLSSERDELKDLKEKIRENRPVVPENPEDRDLR